MPSYTGNISYVETSYPFTGIGTYPINLIQIIRQEYYAADDTRAIGDFHLDIDMAEEEVECSLYSRRVPFFTDDECGALRCAIDSAGSRVPKFKS